MEDWLSRQLGWLALLPIALFVAVAFQHAAPTYLHPDEAQQFMRADVDSLLQAFRNSLTQSHPPGYILFLYLAKYISRDELFLRGLSIAASAGALYLTFAWLRRACSDRVAAAGLLLMAGSPGLLSVAPQIRQYGLLMLAIAGALYAMERFLQERSVTWTVVYSVALGAMLFTYYGAGWIALALGLYVPLRFWIDRTDRKVVLTWAGFQAAAVLLGAWIGWTHLADLQHDINWAARGFLRGSYYMGQGSPWQWMWGATSRVFQYIAHGLPLREHRWFGSLLLAAFGLGLAMLLVRQWRRWDYTALLALPVLLACAGGVLKLLPYGGTRHTSYLLPFVIAGAAVAVATLLPRLSWVGVVLGLSLPLRLLHANPVVAPQRVPLAHMDAAVRFIRANIAHEDTIFVDRQAFYLLRYYLGSQGSYLGKLPHANESYLDGYRVFWPRGTKMWAFQGDSLKQSVALLATTGDSVMQFPERIWVVSHSIAGRRPLRRLAPMGAPYRKFGAIEILQIPFPRRPR